MKHKHRKEIKQKIKEEKAVELTGTVKMIFTEDKFYNDLKNPLYKAGIVYDVEKPMVQRWLKRGGKIVVDAPVVEEPKPVEQDEEKAEDILDSDLE